MRIKHVTGFTTREFLLTPAQLGIPNERLRCTRSISLSNNQNSLQVTSPVRRASNLFKRMV